MNVLPTPPLGESRLTLVLGTAFTLLTLVACGGMQAGEDAAPANTPVTIAAGSEAAAEPRRGGPVAPADMEMPSSAPAEAEAAPPSGVPSAVRPARSRSEGRIGAADDAFGGAAAPSSPAPSPAATSTTTTTVTVETVVEREDVEFDHRQQLPRQLLTAASVGDHDRRDNYLEYLARHRGEASQLGLDMTRRVRFRVVDRDGQPVNDAEVRLLEGAVVGRTHADGVFDLYPNVSPLSLRGRLPVQIVAGQVRATTTIDLPGYGDGEEVVFRLGARATRPTALDLAFLIDVTGSMEDELRYVNTEIVDIVQRIRARRPEVTVRVGATLYRDRSDREVVQQIPFTTDVGGFSRALSTIHASGGGDYPEDMNAGLEAALGRMAWSRGNAARVLVLIADAPPKRYHQATFTYHDALRDAGQRGIRILPVAASGADRTVEYLFRAMGAYTSTPYVYLTDDSGIGNPHMEADTDRVAVEFFNNLLTRLVLSDLSGEGMHEPGLFGGQR